MNGLFACHRDRVVIEVNIKEKYYEIVLLSLSHFYVLYTFEGWFFAQFNYMHIIRMTMKPKVYIVYIIIEILRFKTATRNDDAQTNYFKRMTGQKSCRILSIV